MQDFYDTATGMQYAFESDVTVTGKQGAWVFTAPHGDVLGPYPDTLTPGMAPYVPPVPPTLAQAQAAQTALLSTTCGAAIVAGFSSSALGAENHYPSDQVTQADIALAATYGGSLWCQSGSGVWAFEAHTLAQGQQVQADLHAHIQAQQGHYATLLGEVSAAQSVAAVQAVGW